MLNGRKIEKLIEEYNVSKQDLSDATGMSRTTLYNILCSKRSPSCENVEKIADYFKVPIDSFFDRSVEITGNKVGHSVNGNGNNVSGNILLNECQKENEHLKEIIAEKERTIQILLNQQDRITK